MFNKRIAFCEIKSWTFVGSANAEHFYGKLFLNEGDCENDNGIELTYKLTERQAIYLNKKNSAYNSKLKPGDSNNQFDSENEVYQAAIKYLESNDLLKNYDFILSGNGSAYPEYIIWAAKNYIKKMKSLNKIYSQYNEETLVSKYDKFIDQWGEKAKQCGILNFNNYE